MWLHTSDGRAVAIELLAKRPDNSMNVRLVYAIPRSSLDKLGLVVSYCHPSQS